MLRSLTRSVSKLHLKTRFCQQICQYSRKYSKDWQPGEDQHYEEELEDFDNLKAVLASDKLQRVDDQKRKLVAFKTIERKYFKTPLELNLLTWDAKEQVRYLAAEFSDEWPPERLAESFPISVEGVLKLLKSRHGPRTLDEVIKHDRRVQRHWLALSQREPGVSRRRADQALLGGPVATRYEQLKAEGKLHLLSNAAGVSSLPKPPGTARVAAGTGASGADANNAPSGVFSAIIKEYYDRKPDVTRNKSKAAPRGNTLQEHGEKTQTLLLGLMKNIPGDKKQPGVTQTSTNENVDAGANQVPRRNEDSAAARNVWVPPGEGEATPDSSIMMTLKEELRDTAVAAPAPKSRRSLRSRPNAAASLVSPHLGALQGRDPLVSTWPAGSQGLPVADSLDGRHHDNTGNVKAEAKREVASRQTDNAASVESKAGRHRKYRVSDADKVLEQIRYDVPSGPSVGGDRGRDVPEAYLYDEGSGYQHPLGRVARQAEDKLPATHRRPHESATSNDVIRRGKNVYDTDGEFLYRIP